GAAAVTSKVSSNCETNSDSSMRVISLKTSMSSSLLSFAIVGVPSLIGPAHACDARDAAGGGLGPASGWVVPRADQAAAVYWVSRRDSIVRTALDAGAEKTWAAWFSLAFIAPAALDSSTSRDSRSASLLMSPAVMGRPSMTPPLMTRFGLDLAKSRSPLLAATGSLSTNAMA